MASWKRKVAEQIKKARKQVNSQMRDDLQISIPVIPQQKSGNIDVQIFIFTISLDLTKLSGF